jgi:hypothetical protein
MQREAREEGVCEKFREGEAPLWVLLEQTPQEILHELGVERYRYRPLAGTFGQQQLYPFNNSSTLVHLVVENSDFQNEFGSL